MFVFLVYRLSFISHLAPLNSFFKKASIFENTVISLPTYFLPLTYLNSVLFVVSFCDFKFTKKKKIRK